MLLTERCYEIKEWNEWMFNDTPARKTERLFEIKDAHSKKKVLK